MSRLSCALGPPVFTRDERSDEGSEEVWDEAWPSGTDAESTEADAPSARGELRSIGLASTAFVSSMLGPDAPALNRRHKAGIRGTATELDGR